MKNNFHTYLVDGIFMILLIALAIFFINPFYLWMPDGLEIAFVALFGVGFSLFAAFFWKERPQDERQHEHTLFSGKIAFIAGTGILSLGIIIQSLQHNLDIWLPVTLSAMILSKIIATTYAEMKM